MKSSFDELPIYHIRIFQNLKYENQSYINLVIISDQPTKADRHEGWNSYADVRGSSSNTVWAPPENKCERKTLLLEDFLKFFSKDILFLV